MKRLAKLFILFLSVMTSAAFANDHPPPQARDLSIFPDNVAGYGRDSSRNHIPVIDRNAPLLLGDLGVSDFDLSLPLRLSGSLPPQERQILPRHAPQPSLSNGALSVSPQDAQGLTERMFDGFEETAGGALYQKYAIEPEIGR